MKQETIFLNNAPATDREKRSIESQQRGCTIHDGDYLVLAHGTVILDCVLYERANFQLFEITQTALPADSIGHDDYTSGIKGECVATHYFYDANDYKAALLEFVSKGAFTLQMADMTPCARTCAADVQELH